MQLLYFFESIRFPVLDSIMLALTEFGSETAFLAVALVLYWCVDKRRAYYLMSVGFIGTISNQFLKIACQVPRPWVKDPGFTIVEAAREGAGGYSFPSGHSQTSVGTFGAVAMTERRKWLKAVCIAIAVIVPVTRMYLGVHTPQDVLVGSGMALALLVLLKPVCMDGSEKALSRLFVGMAVLSVVYLAYAELFPFPADIDPANLISAKKNAYTMLGTMLGMTLVYFTEGKKLRFDCKAVWYVQVAKVVGGLIVVLAVKEGLRVPLEALCGGHLVSRSLRYFLIVITAGLLWPMSFPLFAKLSRKDPD